MSTIQTKITHSICRKQRQYPLYLTNISVNWGLESTYNNFLLNKVENIWSQSKSEYVRQAKHVCNIDKLSQ